MFTGRVIFVSLSLAIFLAAAPRVSAAPISSIKLERTACFGTCPVYTVSIFRDGRVEFEGKEYVKEKGKHSRTISAREFEELAAKVEKIGFFALQPSYRANVTDLPTTIVTVTRGSESKRVEDYFGAPQPLRDLEELIARTVKSWVETRGEADRRARHRRNSVAMPPCGVLFSSASISPANAG